LVITNREGERKKKERWQKVCGENGERVYVVRKEKGHLVTSAKFKKELFDEKKENSERNETRS